MPTTAGRSRQVPNGHLADRERLVHAFVVAGLSDSEALDAILISCQYLHVKLDELLGDDGEEEEDEADS